MNSNPFEAQDKLDLVKAVLQCRADIVQRILNTDRPDAMFFRGKLEGYNQAIELLNASFECRKIEKE